MLLQRIGRWACLRTGLLLASLGAAPGLFGQTAPEKPVLPPTVVATYDVVFSKVGQSTAMDIFRPQTGGPHPVILAIHGGGFRRGARSSYWNLCAKAAQRGYVCATTSYRLAPMHQFPAAVEDAKAAVRFLRANSKEYGIDPAKIGVTGGSAGGHLALMLGANGATDIFRGTAGNLDQSSDVQAVVNYFGPTDFVHSYLKSVDAGEVLPLFLGGDLKYNKQAHIQASPLYYVTPQFAPTLTLHGTKDTYVAYEHATWITARLQAAEVEAELETIAGAGHGFKGVDAERAETRLFEFFDRQLKTSAQTRIYVSDHGAKGEVVEMEWPSGRELRRWPNGRGHDVQVLSNGNVLFTNGPGKQATEVDSSGKTVWTCCENMPHILAAQRLANGNTLIGDAVSGQVVEVDSSGKQVWRYASDDIAKMRSRNSHRTVAGTTLIAVEADAKVIEVDSQGQIVWQWQDPQGNKRRLYQARRLNNGNTVMSLSNPGQVVEVDRAGKIVRSIGGTDLAIQMGWTSGFTMLPNGNLLIADYMGRRLLEVDGQGKVVHQLKTGVRNIASIATLP
jgi:acetyl esterase/lipase